jgi:hypothetical protein
MFLNLYVPFQKTPPNTACSGRVGVCAIFKHFSGFGLFSTSQTLSTPAHPPLTQIVGTLRPKRHLKNPAKRCIFVVETDRR